jgi:putative SOS response-associated peptidase YedK
MPVILPVGNFEDWLQEQDLKSLLRLLQPYPAEEMTMYPVSKLVNSPANDQPACILPLEEIR